MKLFIIRPIDPNAPPWDPWYDKCFGMVISAESEQEARLLAHEHGGDENGWGKNDHPWTDPLLSSCVELVAGDKAELIMKDFARS